MHINNGTNAKNIYLWSWLCFVVAIVLLSLLPVLIDSHFCILDCAGCYEITQNITWYNPTTYPYRLLHNRASYGVFLYLFPSYFSLSPALRLWFHSGFMLSVACILVFFLTYKATERKWLGAVCAALALCQPSFTENYYTMFKGEPWILTGALWITYRVWQQLLQHVRRSDWLFGIFLLFIDIVAVMFIYSLKETGAAFLGVYILGLPLLAWGAGITVAQTIKRTWLLSLLNIICFLILFHLYINLPVTYGSSDGLGYVVTVSNLLSGTRQLSRYFFDTASYMIPALAATITASVLYLNSPRMSPVRPQIAWTLYFAVFFGGMIAILIPWVGINPRYYLQGIVGGIIWTVLAANLCLSIMHYCKAQIVKVWAALLLMLIAVLLSMHGTYSVLVGQLSEGRVQQQYDATWNDMFEYVVNNTPTNGVAYFVVDSGQGEVLANISISLRVFYGRKDIKCIFPHTIGNLNEPGLICVPYRESPLNYFRLPCSEQASAQFNRNVLPYLGAEPTNSIYRRASIIYATAVFGKPQYKSVWGIPAFWDLQRGTYEFGWKIYYYDGHLQKYTRKKTNLIWRDLLTNGAFLNGLNGWQYWSDARQQSNCIALMPLQDMSGVRQALRIMNPQKKLVGVQQTVQLESNVVYRMSGSVRSVATNASEILFGGRVALWLPPQPEQQLVWMSEYNNWLHGLWWCLVQRRIY
ncbi:MAG: hypothetical protein NTV22_01640 [bacterium]|nr:hypothetical protein [bacterium]